MSNCIILEKHLTDNSVASFHYSQAVNEASVKITQRGKVNGKLKIIFTFKIDMEFDKFKTLLEDILFKEIDKEYILKRVM